MSNPLQHPLSASRRKLLKATVIGGVGIYFSPLMAQGPSNLRKSSLNAPDQWREGKQAKFRMDALQKVTGQKLFGRDFRAQDFPDWPQQQWHGYLLCSTQADRPFLELDLSMLPEPPSQVVLAEDLAAQGVTLPAFYGQEMLLRKGEVAQFLGHPVALLLFKDFDQFNLAKSRLDFNETVIRYGEKTDYYRRDPYASWRAIRIHDSEATGNHSGNDASKDQFSTFQDGLFFPAYEMRQPKWPTEKNLHGSLSEKGMFYADELAQQLKTGADGKWHVSEITYQTQIIEPMMMEPEAANAWYDEKSQTLHVVPTIQDPTDFAEMVTHMLKTSRSAQSLKNVVIYTGYIGGGFGAKDHTIFPYYTVAASLFTGGAPVRIANDRYQQFQNGLKRHPFHIKAKVAVNKETLELEALYADLAVDGGGRENFSASVASAGMSAMQGIYRFKRNDLQATAYHSRNVSSGSMRGYGSTQCMPVVDLLVGQAAQEMGVSHFALRKKNALKTGDLNTQGAKIDGEVHYLEMLEKAEQNPIWQNREAKKRQFESENPDYYYGVGYSILPKNFGTGNVGPNAAVSLSADGQVNLEIEYIEMGTGTQTSQALLCAPYFGQAAHQVELGVVDKWQQTLKLIETDNPYIISQEKQDAEAKNPRWTPVRFMASSASDSAYFQSEASKGACEVVYRNGILPAARSLWSLPADADLQAATWTDAGLSLSGQNPLSLSALAKEAHGKGFVVSAVAHSHNRWKWVEAEFSILNETKTYTLDAVAVQYGAGADAELKQKMTDGGYHFIERNWVNYPETRYNNAMVTYYAPCDCLLELKVHRYTGAVTVLSAHSVLECGAVISKELVDGQMQGGFAMGLGHVLYEYLPPFEAGAGNGTWNLNRYRVPLASDIPLWNLSVETLPSRDSSKRAKGMGEVVMLPVISAVQDALFHAIQQRFNSTPITSEQILAQLSARKS